MDRCVTLRPSLGGKFCAAERGFPGLNLQMFGHELGRMQALSRRPAAFIEPRCEPSEILIVQQWQPGHGPYGHVSQALFPFDDNCRTLSALTAPAPKE
jgi:hypothetical protein